MSESIPTGWATALVRDVTVPVAQRGPTATESKFFYIDLGSLDRQSKLIVEPKRLSPAEAPSRAKQIVRSGDTLFSNVRVYLENIALVPEEMDEQIASTAFCVLRPAQGILPRYLNHYVRSRPFVLAVNALQRGNSPPSVQDGDVRSQSLPVPPTQEQKRIVSKIEGCGHRRIDPRLAREA